MTRLIMVPDEKTGFPVWFDIIPGNVLDINTIMTTINNVAVTLNIEIDSLALDAGYISKEVILAVYILFHTGLRVSEFCGLTIKDIDLDRKILNIDHQIQRTSGMKYVIESTKTKAGTIKFTGRYFIIDVSACFRYIFVHTVSKAFLRGLTFNRSRIRVCGSDKMRASGSQESGK